MKSLFQKNFKRNSPNTLKTGSPGQLYLKLIHTFNITTSDLLKRESAKDKINEKGHKYFLGVKLVILPFSNALNSDKSELFYTIYSDDRSIAYYEKHGQFKCFCKTPSNNISHNFLWLSRLLK